MNQISLSNSQHKTSEIPLYVLKVTVSWLQHCAYKDNSILSMSTDYFRPFNTTTAVLCPIIQMLFKGFFFLNLDFILTIIKQFISIAENKNRKKTNSVKFNTSNTNILLRSQILFHSVVELNHCFTAHEKLSV